MKDKKEQYSSSKERKDPFYLSMAFQMLLLVLLIISLVLSTIALTKDKQGESSLPTAQSIIERLSSHSEMEPLRSTTPVNLVQITDSNIAALQAQIQGLDSSYLGNYLVQYPNAIIIYDYEKNALRGTIALEQSNTLPDDFFPKLYAHEQMKGLESEQPVGGRLDSQSLATLQSQFPQVYANAKVGDFLLRYQSRLVVYDYNQNAIVSLVQLQ